MEKYAFLSRHAVTPQQEAIARYYGVELVPIGDMDAFTVNPSDIAEHGEFVGVAVVHPAAALRLNDVYHIGVFENANRAPEGERPTFEPVEFHRFHRRPRPSHFG